MAQALFYVALLITIGIIAFSLHIRQNPVLDKQNRIFLILASLALIVLLLTESASLCLEGHPEYRLLYQVNLTISLIASTWIVPCQLFGFSFPKAGRIVSVLGLIYTAFFLIASPLGFVFSVSREGLYQLGKGSVLLTLLVILWACLSLLMLVGLGMRFHAKRAVILILVATIEILSQVFSMIGTYDIIRTLGMAFAFLLIYSYFENLTEQELYADLELSNRRNKELSLQVVNALAGAVDAKDKYTNGHSRRVAEYSVLLARELGWDENRLSQLKYDALMHDIGKIGIPDSVLNKPGRLTDAEFDIIKSHTVFGSDILSEMTTLPGAYQAARWHHERYDGRGYPDKRSGRDIPEIARIISIADTFDAMNSDRIYRRALPGDIIIKELEKGKGSQFDPDLAEVFLKLYREGATDEIAAEGRQDIRSSEEDPLAGELAPVFHAFLKDREQPADLSKASQEIAGLCSSLRRTAEKNRTDIEIALVTVKAAADFTLSEDELEMALTVMLRSISSTATDLLALERLSETQIMAVRRVTDGPDLAQFLQIAFVNYYKIYNAEKLDVRFEILS